MDGLTAKDLPKRLIVLIPDYQAVTTGLAHKIHWIADSQSLSVFYLVLLNHNENNLAVSRSMATLKAVTSANRLSVEVKQTESSRWLETLREVSCPGDVIICQEEQTVINERLKALPIHEFLSAQLNMPAQNLSDLDPRPDFNDEKYRPNQFFMLMGYLVILALFTWLEIGLDKMFEGSLQNVFVMIAFCVEVGALWAWFMFNDC
jgi:hypothetical protein